MFSSMMIQHPAAPVRQRTAPLWRQVPAARLVTMAFVLVVAVLAARVDAQTHEKPAPLVDLAADLTVASACTRASRSITPEDQIWLVDHYTAQLGQGSASGSNGPHGTRDKEAR
jgi:hypothetical protein